MFLAKRSSWSSKNIPLLLKLDSGRNSSPSLYLLSIESKDLLSACSRPILIPFLQTSSCRDLKSENLVADLER